MSRRPASLSRFALVGLLALGALTGCDEARVANGPTLESDDSNFQEGKRLVGEGKPRQALESFEKVILTRRDAPESHLEAGNLCLDTEIKDPLLAIFHFRIYLKSQPDNSKVMAVSQRIRSAEKEFLKTLPFRPVESSDADRVAEWQDKLGVVRTENDRLKRELAAALAAAKAGSRLADDGASDSAPGPVSDSSGSPTLVSSNLTTPPAGNTTAGNTTPRPAAGKRRHVIAKGDNLSKISSKYYGTPARWRDILNANRNVMRNERDLKLGAELVIPD